MVVLDRVDCFESATHEVSFHRVPFRAVLRRGEPGRVAREIVIVPVGSVWLQVYVEVVFPSLGWPSSRCWLLEEIVWRAVPWWMLPFAHILLHIRVVLATGLVSSNTRVRVLFGVFIACDVPSFLATGALPHSVTSSEMGVASTHMYHSAENKYSYTC